MKRAPCSACGFEHGECYVCNKATEEEQDAARKRAASFRRYITDPKGRMADGSEIPPGVRSIMQAFAGTGPLE